MTDRHEGQRTDFPSNVSGTLNSLSQVAQPIRTIFGGGVATKTALQPGQRIRFPQVCAATPSFFWHEGQSIVPAWAAAALSTTADGFASIRSSSPSSSLNLLRDERGGSSS
jgi:hypothetical protein